MNFGIWELVVILVIVALLFGTKKLGTIGSDLGNAIKGLRNAMREDDSAAAAQKKGEAGSGQVNEGEAQTKNDRTS